MTSPLLDEELILENLDPDYPTDPDTLRGVELAFVVDAYDRKVEREEFYNITQKCFCLLNAVTVMEYSTRLYQAYRRSETPSPALEDGMKATYNTMKAYRGDLHMMLQRVMECPETEDKIN